ncbi:MAG: hypothetical protein Q9164_004921 [Protoblastenia rupestris]
MATSLLGVRQTSLPEHCTPTTEFLLKLSSTFHACVPTSLALLSTSLGILSIVAWLFAQLPQIFKNYKLKSASGLSIYFLTEWLLGDLTNLLGALLTGQAQWQVGIATYYVIVDVCLTSQYLWYTHFKSWKTRKLRVYTGDGDWGSGGSREVLMTVDPVEEHIDGDSGKANCEINKSKAQEPPGGGNGSQKLDLTTSAVPFGEKPTREPQKAAFVRPTSRTGSGTVNKTLLVSLLCVTAAASPLPGPHAHWDSYVNTMQVSSRVEFIGRIFSWMSTLLYLGSRLPQIYKNAIRRSTSGLSPYMFLAAFCGNFLYSSAIIANPLAWTSYPPYGAHGWVGSEGSDRLVWIGLAAPFWLGAAGVLFLDATVGIQFLVYGDGSEVEILVEDRQGRSRWREVTGWMRGWIPSPSPAAHVGGANDEERPLVARRASRSSRYSTI